jgi:hypothetical protein
MRLGTAYVEKGIIGNKEIIDLFYQTGLSNRWLSDQALQEAAE